MSNVACSAKAASLRLVLQSIGSRAHVAELRWLPSRTVSTHHSTPRTNNKSESKSLPSYCRHQSSIARYGQTSDGIGHARSPGDLGRAGEDHTATPSLADEPSASIKPARSPGNTVRRFMPKRFVPKSSLNTQPVLGPKVPRDLPPEYFRGCHYAREKAQAKNQELRQAAKDEKAQRFPVEKQWVKTMDLLKDMTPRGLERREEKRPSQYTIPQSHQMVLNGSVADAVEEVMLCTGSELRLGEVEESDDGTSRFANMELFGTVEQNSAAELYIDKSSRFVLRRRTDISLEDASSESAVITSEHTPVSIHRYVRSMVATSHRYYRRKAGKEDAPAHVNVLHQDLADFLCQRQVVERTPAPTLKLAFMFFIEGNNLPLNRQIHRAHAHAAGQSKNHIKSLTIDVYNVLLRDALHSQDIAIFVYYLEDMRNQGLLVNAETWTYFHELTSILLPANTGLILSQLQKKGIATSTKEIKQDQVFANYLFDARLPVRVHFELAGHSIRTLNAKLFLDHESRYHADRWKMSHRYLSMLIEMLLSGGNWNEALRAVEVFRQQGNTFPGHAFETFLEFCTRPGIDSPAALVIVLLQFTRCYTPDREKEYGFPAQQATNTYRPQFIPRLNNGYLTLTRWEFHKLFRILETNQCWNMLRVVWRHACCADKVSWYMRQRMLKHLDRYTSPPADPTLLKQWIWQTRLAPFARGVKANNRHAMSELFTGPPGKFTAQDEGANARPVQQLAWDMNEAWKVDQRFREFGLWPQFEAGSFEEAAPILDKMDEMGYDVETVRAVKQNRMARMSPMMKRKSRENHAFEAEHLEDESKELDLGASQQLPEEILAEEPHEYDGVDSFDQPEEELNDVEMEHPIEEVVPAGYAIHADAGVKRSLAQTVRPGVEDQLEQPNNDFLAEDHWNLDSVQHVEANFAEKMEHVDSRFPHDGLPVLTKHTLEFDRKDQPVDEISMESSEIDQTLDENEDLPAEEDLADSHDAFDLTDEMLADESQYFIPEHMKHELWLRKLEAELGVSLNEHKPPTLESELELSLKMLDTRLQSTSIRPPP